MNGYNGGGRMSVAPQQGQGYPIASRLSTIGVSRPSLGPPRISLARGGSSAIGGMAGVVDGMGNVSLGQNRISDVRMSGIGRTMGAVSRRSSQYAGRPSNMGIATGGGITKDPRPIRDKSWQGNAIRNLINFLVQTGFNQPISVKTLQAPSAKDFQSIFKFLYAQLDPEYVFQKKFEEEVPVILKGLRYPFEVSKSHLYSVGSMHAWPALLAMLTWITELIICCEKMDTVEDIDDGAGLPEEIPPERTFFDYVTKAYAQFLQGDDNYESMDKELTDKFDQKNEQVLVALERLETEHDILEKEWKELSEGEPPVVVLEREGKVLQADRDKFKQYIQHIEGKTHKLQDTIVSLKEDLEAKEKEIAELTEEKVTLQKTVDAQEISPADVDRMTAEREQLNKTLEAVAQKMDEANNSLWEKEIALQKKMDQLEKFIQEYNAFAYKLGLLGPDPPEPELAAELELRGHATRPDQMVSLDLRNAAKPKLMQLRARYNNKLHKAQDDSIALQEAMDNLNWSYSQKKEELMELDQQVKQLADRYKEEQEQIGMTNNAKNEEVQQLEKNIQKMKVDANGILLHAQQKYQKAVIEYDEVNTKCAASREQVLAELGQSLITIFNFHQHIHQELDELHQEAEMHFKEAAGGEAVNGQ